MGRLDAFDMTEKPNLPFANTAQFYAHLGWFYSAWSSVDLSVDLAICRCLKISPEQTHMLVAGLEFGRKTALLRSVLSTSGYTVAEVEKLKGYLTRISKESLRNVFAHSFLASDTESVHFIHRKSQGAYSATGYKFMAEGFVQHVKDFVQLAHDFEKALGFSHKDIGDFAAAAVKEESHVSASLNDPSREQ
jgi:hypothetical protein